MLDQFLWAILLTSATVALHTAYSFYLIRAVRHQRIRRLPHIGDHPHRLFLLVQSVVVLLLLHCVETTLWALYYMHDKGLPDFATSLYFSMISYATIGYGDVVLPARMRLVGAIEGMVGTMMAGWSVALIVAVLQSLTATPAKKRAEASEPASDADA